MIEVTQEIDAPAEDVYALVCDLPRMGEWSPETARVSWMGKVREPVVGARFRGDNRRGWLRWSTFGVITAAEPGREFSFEVGVGLPVARWGYRFEPLGADRCRVTEWTEDRRGAAFKLFSVVSGMKERADINRANMQVTLDRLKAAAETRG